MGLLDILQIEYKVEFVSSPADNRSGAEFAKRLFVHGKEISPLPLRLLNGNLLDEASFVVESLKKGHQLSINTFRNYPGDLNRLKSLLLIVYVFMEMSTKNVKGSTTAVGDEIACITVEEFNAVLYALADEEVGTARGLLSKGQP
jgi:hypothetical protein